MSLFFLLLKTGPLKSVSQLGQTLYEVVLIFLWTFKDISESCIYFVVIHKVWWNGNSFFRFLQFFHVICFLVSMFSSLRTEVRGDFNFHGTKWCCKPPVLLVGQKNCPLHEMLTRLVITENAFFDGKQHPKNICFHGC